VSRPSVLSRLPGILFVAALVASLQGAAAFAQCGPDGLSGGPCCTGATAVLPNFPALSLGVKYICWDNCGVRLNRDVCIDLGQPRPVQQNGGNVCGVYVIPVTVRTCGAAARVAWTGNLTAHYTRNWVTLSGPGGTPDLCVWRFLLNGDVIPSAFALQRYGNNRCVVPACFATFSAIYVQGYIDYAFRGSLAEWTASGAFDHGCDAFTHSSLSARPAPAGGLDPGRSYTWVFPAADFSPFDAGTTVPASGGSLQLGQCAFRTNYWPIAPSICLMPEPVFSGGVGPQSSFCSCPTGGSGALQFVDTIVMATGACTSSLNAGGSSSSFVQKRIGNWTNPGVFPGPQSLLLGMGIGAYLEGCTRVTSPQYFEGVETIGGFAAQTYSGAALGRQLEDWGSSNPRPAPGTTPTPSVVIGVPHLTWYLTYLTLP
jgi:hypothetical protein